ncbi:metallophosphatase [Bacteroidia bacterium]|nr:metallophosphatase [Bacteroidia bacterium]
MKNKFTRSGAFALLLFVVLGFAACQQSTSTHHATKRELKFHEDGKFKVAQFTDPHWVHGNGNTPAMESTIRYVLQTEKPDVAVLTGDIITGKPAKESWEDIMKIFDEEKIPYAVVLGNHDRENWEGDSIFDLLATSPYFVGEKGPQELYGIGTYALPVKASKSNKTAAVLYCMDSNDYCEDDNLGYYDWFHRDQIEWYRKTSQAFTAANNNQPLPALAFFHIPLVEYDAVINNITFVGAYEEPTCPGILNTGMLASMIEMGDVMGTFCGHDHSNDYIGIFGSVALAYGRCTHVKNMGSRIIELTEGHHVFSTWIRTPEKIENHYLYPAGIELFEDEDITFTPAINKQSDKQGVKYAYYEGEFQSVEDLSAVKPIKSGVASSIAISEAKVDRYYGFTYDALIKIPKKDVYYFYTNSDDGSKLYIDNQLIVNNDSTHSATRINGYIALEAGFHQFSLKYFADAPNNSLKVGVMTRATPEVDNLDALLYIEE